VQEWMPNQFGLCETRSEGGLWLRQDKQSQAVNQPLEALRQLELAVATRRGVVAARA